MIYLVRQALESCSNKTNLVLKVSPADYEYITGNMDRLASLAPGSGDIEIKQDLSLEPGSCIIDSAFGSVDAGVRTRLRKIEEAFREILEGR